MISAVVPVNIELPGKGVFTLRFTLGARKRIVERFGVNVIEAIRKFSSGALPGIMYELLYDADGNPPAVTLAWLENNLPADTESETELLSAVLSAATQGKQAPKAFEDLLTAAMRPTGLSSGPSAPRSSDSPTDSSGTATSNAKLKLVSDGTSESSESSESSLAPSPQPA